MRFVGSFDVFINSGDLEIGLSFSLLFDNVCSVMTEPFDCLSSSKTCSETESTAVNRSRSLYKTVFVIVSNEDVNLNDALLFAFSIWSPKSATPYLSMK